MNSAQEYRMLVDELTEIFESNNSTEDQPLEEASHDVLTTPEEMAPKKTKKGVQNYARKDGQSFPEKKGFTG